jgi:hypothetical protein
MGFTSTGSKFTHLDIAKAFIESIYFATKSQPNVHYMLLISYSPHSSSPILFNERIKASSCLLTSLGESHAAFEEAVKLVQVQTEVESPTNFSTSLSFAMDIINKYRIKVKVFGSDYIFLYYIP